MVSQIVYTDRMASRLDARLVSALRKPDSVVSVELRPPRAELGAAAGMNAWVDTHHAVRRFARDDTFVFLTDSAVGTREEHTIRHLVANLGEEVERDHVVPFLTAKHSLDFCLTYAERAWHEGFRSLVVLGGDHSVGQPRCVDHAWQLRQKIRAVVPDLALGGWANPHADPDAQVGYLTDVNFTAEFYLTQVVSHHDIGKVERFLTAASRQGLDLQGVFGVFYYRSANARTLEVLSQFLPVPVEALTAEFAAGASPEAICAASIRALHEAGVRHVYVSNLPIGSARQTLQTIAALARQPA